VPNELRHRRLRELGIPVRGRRAYEDPHADDESTLSSLDTSSTARAQRRTLMPRDEPGGNTASASLSPAITDLPVTVP